MTKETVMITKVSKRDGRVVNYNKKKIFEAMSKAFMEVDGSVTDEAFEIIGKIIATLENSKKEQMDVEDIQDYIEKALMNSRRKDVAKKYIIYRSDRDKIRNRKRPSSKEFEEKILGNKDDKQNANVDGLSFGGRKGEAANVIQKQYALDYCMSDMARNNHLSNEIYIHDLDSYAVGMHNCLSIPFDDLLANGFNTRQTDVRPANSINTAFQLVAVIFQLQSLQQFGGVSATHLDWTMIPYIRKSFYKHYLNGCKYIEDQTDSWMDILKNDLVNNNPSIDDDIYFDKESKAYQYAMDMTIKETKQAVEGMYHNLNTLQSRSGNQLPFTSINYGTCTLPEGRMVIKAFPSTV